MVKLLIDSAADLFALSEGGAPFTTVRLGGHDDICELLARRGSATQTFGYGPESRKFDVR